MTPGGRTKYSRGHCAPTGHGRLHAERPPQLIIYVDDVVVADIRRGQREPPVRLFLNSPAPLGSESWPRPPSTPRRHAEEPWSCRGGSTLPRRPPHSHPSPHHHSWYTETGQRNNYVSNLQRGQQRSGGGELVRTSGSSVTSSIRKCVEEVVLEAYGLHAASIICK